MAVFDQPADQRDDLSDMIGCTRMNGGRMNAEGFGILVILGDKPVGQFLYGDAFFIGAADHFVIDIGKILNERDIIPFPLQLPAEYVERNERAGISDMEEIIYSRTAGVDADFSFMDRNKFLFSAGHAVEYIHRSVSPFVMNQNADGSQNPDNRSGDCRDADRNCQVRECNA